MRQKLTDLAIQRLPHPEKGDVKYWDNGLPGFGVRVTTRSKAFFIAYGAKRQLKTLGRYPDITLKDARIAAKRFQTSLTEKVPSTSVTMLSGAREAFLAECEDKNRPNTVRSYRLYLEQITKKRLDEVERDDVPNSPHAIMAAKIFFNWCMRQGFTDRNPFQFERVSYGERSRVLSDDELRQVWNYEAPPFSDHLKLLILTGQRRSQFKSFTVQNDTIIFPKEVMKGKREHTIPLTPKVKEVLDRLQSFNSWSKAKAKMDKTVQIPHWTIHDLRRTFATKHAELGTAVHVIEKILDHQSGTISGVASIYNRYSYLKEASCAQVAFEKYLQSGIFST